MTARTIRVFIAFELPAAIREFIRREQRALKAELPRARWTRPDGQHLTLKFLGEIEANLVEPLASSVATAVSGRSPVTVALGGAGFFPTPRRPRVAWLGGEAPGGSQVAAAVDEAAVGEGFAPERRPWSLHLTQARLDRPWPRGAVERFLDWGRTLDLPSFRCHDIVLFRSELRPGGAVYTALERIELA